MKDKMKRRITGMWALIALVASVGSFSPAANAGGIELTLGDALEGYQQFLLRFDRCRFKMTVSTSTESPVVPTGSTRLQWNADIFRDGTSRFRILFTTSSTFQENGKSVTRHEGSEYNIIGSTKTWINWHGARTSEKHVNAWLDSLTHEDRLDAEYGHQYCPVLNGYLEQNGRSGLVALLRKGNPILSKTKLNGTDVVRLDGRTEWGKLSVWLDPNRGYAPLRIVQSKGVDDFIVPGKSIGSTDWGKEFAAPVAKKIGIDYAVDVDYGPGTDVGPTMTMRAVQTDRYENAQKRTIVDDIKVTNLDLGPIPEREFALTTPVPNKTYVNVENHSNLLYEWRDGQIVKIGIAEPVEAPAVVASRPLWRWLVGSVLLVAALVIAWLLYGKFRHQKVTP